MNRDDIQAEFDRFIEFPYGRRSMAVTVSSAMLFAEHIARMATDAERRRCAQIADAHASIEGIAQTIAAEIRSIK